MTKTTKALLTSAAFAGLFAGTGAAVKASTLLPLLNNSFSAQDQDQGDKKDDQKVKEKHACKGQNSCKGKGGCKASDNGCKGKNSCKGKGGCATDGSKPPRSNSKGSSIQWGGSANAFLALFSSPDGGKRQYASEIVSTDSRTTESELACGLRTTSTSCPASRLSTGSRLSPRIS